MTANMYIPKIQLESGSTRRCDLLIDQSIDAPTHAHLISRCRDLVYGTHWEIKIIHIRHTNNGDADLLVNWSLCLLDNFVEYIFAQDFIRDFLPTDVTPIRDI